MRPAGSREAFFRVDRDYPFAVAKNARAGGALAFVLIASMGDSRRNRNFYLHPMGEAEAAIAECGYVSLTTVHPGLLGGHRAEFRLGERLGLIALRAIGPLLPRRFRISPADRVAATMFEAAVASQPGTNIIESEHFAY